MRKYKKRLSDLEKKMSPDPPPVIYSTSQEEAAEKLKQFYLDYPDALAPIVYIVTGDLDKPPNAGL